MPNLLDLSVVFNGMEINNGINYEIVEITGGGVTWEHFSVTADNIHGELRVNSRKSEARSMLRIRIMGELVSDYLSNRDALILLAEDEGYDVVIKIEDEQIEGWANCGPADITFADGGYGKFGLMTTPVQQEYIFEIPHSPIPLEEE